MLTEEFTRGELHCDNFYLQVFTPWFLDEPSVFFYKCSSLRVELIKSVNVFDEEEVKKQKNAVKSYFWLLTVR